MKKHTLLFLIFIISLLSCKKGFFNNDSSIIFEGRKTNIKISLNNGSKTGELKYALYLEEADAMMKYSHTHGILDGKQNPTGYNISASFENMDVGIIHFNDIRLKPIPALNSEFRYVDIANNSVSELFDTVVSFSIEDGNQTYEIFEQSLEMPKKFELSEDLDDFSTQRFNYEVQPDVSRTVHGINRNNFNINWNADKNNENGVVVILEWLGTTLDEDGQPVDNSSYKRNVEIIDDNGSYSFNNFASEDIPENAIVTIKILRGNIEIVALESKSIKVYGTSEIIFPAICLM